MTQLVAEAIERYLAEAGPPPEPPGESGRPERGRPGSGP